MKKWIVILAVLTMILSLTACGGEESTVTGMVVSVDGTTISLMEMEGGFDGRMPMGEKGEMPTRPEGMEDFNPEDMEDFTIPEGMENFDPEKMEDFNFEDFNPEDMPEGFGPGGFGEGERPEMPEGERPDMGNFEGTGEATTLDIANAHISVEIEGGKESGSMDNIVPGSMVTVTIDAKGNATYVLVSRPMGFGGFNMPTTK